MINKPYKDYCFFHTHKMLCIVKEATKSQCDKTCKAKQEIQTTFQSTYVQNMGSSRVMQGLQISLLDCPSKKQPY